jgi:hypothetical protein
MRHYTILTVLLLFAASLLSTCRTPPPSAYDRPPNALKFHSGGYNPGTRNPGKHHH